MPRRRADSAAAKAGAARARGPLPPAAPIGRHFTPRHKAPLWLKIAAVAVSGVLVLVLGTAGVLIMKLQENVTTAPLNAGVLADGRTKAPVEDSGSLQVLILGTDTRAGKNSEYGTAAESAGQGNSDVMLLMNISADNSQVSVTSFPRDLMVPIPDCKSAATGQVVPGQAMGQLNSALSAGPGCTVAAINELTGLTIDHFMLADFTAVKELSNALGGVQVCVNHAMYDVNGSFLKLPAGKSLVKGEQALAFLRTRHAFGDSSDLDRIKAQQYFLGSMVRKVKEEGTLTNLPKLYQLADVVTKNLTIDEGLANIPAMVGIATRLAKINLANVSFVTVPTEPYVADPNRVQLKEPSAGQFFAALRHDTALTKAPAAPSATPSAHATGAASTSGASGAASAAPAPSTRSVPATTTPAYDKAAQPIGVANASAIAGRATEVLQSLATAGFTNSWAAGDVAAQNETRVLYGHDMGDVAADIAKHFKIPASAVKSDPSISGVQLVIGTDWTSGTEFGKIVVPKDIVASTADQSGGCLTVNPLYYTY
ncbi:LCP family protein [Arthrobacter wenxiniae]|uniref:LCP family protein n=1 Tax=Arthrobacter wenxiniae TaxID=2713570 RepID=A0A7Y7IJW5_9MICC|nr:LCP family protein [Arthrobacter wenxiniae]NVM96813.1 LCP family protein [Arthrobacter wenxiniae]